MSPKKSIKLYLFGDSISFGQLVSSHKTWATELARALEEISKDVQFLVQNAGVNGNTTRQALERMHYDVTSHRPEYVLVQFGMNDCNYWETDCGLPRVTPAAFVANIEEIIRKCLVANAKHCIINTNHPSAKGHFPHFVKKGYDESNSEYNVYIREVFEKMRQGGLPVTLFDMEKSWDQYLRLNPAINLQQLLLNDGIHLSDAGHQLYISSLVPEIVARIRDFEGL